MTDQKASEPETSDDSPAPAPTPGSDAPPTASSTPAPGLDPDLRVSALEAERNDFRDRMLRIAAEFENYKKRVRREQGEGEAKAREAVLRDVLEIADNLERAAAVDEKADFKSLQKGVDLVLRLLHGKLERHDVRPFDSKGQAFDPRIHDAVSQVPSADAPPGSVIGEVAKGYRLGDRLLRPALVVVAAPPAAPSGNGAAP